MAASQAATNPISFIAFRLSEKNGRQRVEGFQIELGTN
jgi:hypothetical protein